MSELVVLLGLALLLPLPPDPDDGDQDDGDQDDGDELLDDTIYREWVA